MTGRPGSKSPSRDRAARPWATTAALFALFLAAAAPAAVGLTIRGHVYRGMERSPEAKISVTLHVVRGEEELPGQTQVSGKDGAFRFEGVPSGAGLEHYVATEFKGVVYTEGPIAVEGREEATQDLIVFDVGRNVESVAVTHQHVIVEKKPEGFQVTEIMVIENSGENAYLSVGVNHAENAGVRIGLPASIRDFHPGMGGDEQTVRVQGRELTSLRPIPPGTHPFTFTYFVPFSGRIDLSHRLYFPTSEFVVMLDDPKLHVESSSLEFVGPKDQGGKQYQVYKAAGLPLGAEVRMRLAGASFWSNPSVYPWLAAPFAIAAVLVFARRRGRWAAGRSPAGGEVAISGAAGGRVEASTHRRPAREPERGGAEVKVVPAPRGAASRRTGVGDDIHQVYLHLLAALDEGLERGEYSKESHALVRGNLKRRLEAILADQPHARAR